LPECTPDSALGPGGLYVNVRVPGLVRLKPGDLIRGAWGNLLQGHPPVSEQDYRCDVGQVQAGQRVLINGAGGGVGTYAVQIAATLGAEVTCGVPEVCMPCELQR
jgi:hypothetical protein